MILPVSASVRISTARTFLFVPGNRPERFDKAAASGADLVVLDLEDAVPPDAKLYARKAVKTWLCAGGEALVRINADQTGWFEDDLALASESRLLGIMLPKAELGDAIERVSRIRPTIALIESGKGVAEVSRIASTQGVERLAFGTIDLALDLDTACEEVLRTIGTNLVVASSASGIASPVDGVTTSFDDPQIVETAMRDARKRGFGAKLCIHPAQLMAVRNAFRPTSEQRAQAARIVAADHASQGAAVALDGQMIDKPMVARAHRILADASAFEASGSL